MHGVEFVRAKCGFSPSVSGPIASGMLNEQGDLTYQTNIKAPPSMPGDFLYGCPDEDCTCSVHFTFGLLQAPPGNSSSHLRAFPTGISSSKHFSSGNFLRALKLEVPGGNAKCWEEMPGGNA